MFKHTKTFSSFSVDNIEKAKQFYGEVLQLEVKENKEFNLLELHVSGGYVIMIYEKSNHEPATFTVLNFSVKNVEKTVSELNEFGIYFEHYTGEIETDEKGIMKGNGPTIAWFKDPAGNILSVVEQG